MSDWSVLRNGWERSVGKVMLGGREVSKGTKAVEMRWDSTPAAFYDEQLIVSYYNGGFICRAAELGRRRLT